MAYVSLTCPHCYSKSQLKVIGFNYDQITRKQGQAISLGTFCPGCLMPVAVLAQRMESDLATFLSLMNGLIASQHPIEPSKLKYLDHWPKLIDPQIPAHLPKPVEKSYLQAEKNFPLDGHEEAAGLMYRRALELALSEKYPERKGTLASTIKDLVAEKILTEDLGNWANEVRLVGNDAAHASEVTRDDLEMMRAFADAVLKYVWTLPTQVQQRRSSKLISDGNKIDS
jgi:hypothetical protein